MPENPRTCPKTPEKSSRYNTRQWFRIHLGIKYTCEYTACAHPALISALLLFHD